MSKASVLILALLAAVSGCTTITFEEEDTETMTTKDQNFGNQVKLLGSNIGDTRKLIRVSEIAKEDITHRPWLIAVSCTVESTNLAAFGTPVAKGTFGSGGVTHTITFDVKPDTLIALPGTSVDLDVYWDDIFLQDSSVPPRAKATRPVASGMPTSAVITASAKQGSVSTPNATRTMFFSIGTPATGVIFEIPKFSSSMMVYPIVEADYATTSIVFFADPNGAFPIASYTGAVLQAVKNAGGFIPIPGSASHMQMIVVGEANPRAMFNLNL